MTTALQFSGHVERKNIFTPFGIRFWDPVTNNQILDGLRVTARPLQGGGTVKQGVRTASGIYAFHGLSGLHEVEYPKDDSVRNVSPPFARRFIFHVSDNLQRFLDAVFTVDLPFRGIYPTDTLNALGNRIPGFYLFSAPTRQSISTWAVVRAQLVEKTNSTADKPAANAVVEIIEPNNRIWFGIADEEGRVAVMFPYPSFTGAPNIQLSPPLAKRQQQWRMRVRVRYAPTALMQPSGSLLPELRSILNQPRGMLWANPSTPGNSLATTLTYGEEIIIRTHTQSELWIRAT
ncbi:MAG: hypothetical protein IPN42_02450 [Methylococcaceae bacterium]|nr:hypothetical protein [Methylococcaceae bacterium]